MEFSAIFALAIATFIFVMTPGPGIVALLARTLSSGMFMGFMISLGLISGDFIYLIAVLASLHSVADIVAPYMVYVRLFGAIYLGYIGVMQWRSPPLSEAREVAALASRSVWQTYFAGVAISATNPKVIVFYLSFLPAFVDLATLTLQQAIIVSVTIAAMLLLGCFIYMSGAHSLYRLIKDDKAAAIVNRITGGLIIMVAIAMVWTI